ncbi:hypothetical protein KM92DES2_11480 [uncultured Desulfovibrio sp.]|uniref:Uncharacterized protein n=1 Tax=uncultured Desulfovibrio sp. TaxID=167968 RepID=A0A212JPI7_9BACT|nr:hypothetical protein KM92DES2_11480 [uncultured Desulfovibrio sp.]
MAKTCRLHAIVYKKVQQPPNAAVPDYSLLILHFGSFLKKISFQKKKGHFYHLVVSILHQSRYDNSPQYILPALHKHLDNFFSPR